METIEIKINDEFIKLTQVLKLAGVVGDGAEAKYLIKDGFVKYNGEVCLMRNKKVYINDIIICDIDNTFYEIIVTC